MVCSQSPKRVAFPVRGGRDDVADLDLAVRDDHAVDQQFEQGPLAVEVGRFQALAHAPAERLGVGRQPRRLVPAFGVVHEVVLLALERG